MALSANNTQTFTSGELVTAAKLNATKIIQPGTTTENNAFTGTAGQLTFDTEKEALVLHNGSLVGGVLRLGIPNGINVFEYIPASYHSSIIDGTNTSDLTAYVQAAIDAVPSAGGSVHFPSGTYVIGTGGLSLSSSNIVLEGAGQTYLKSTRLYYTDHGDGTFSVGQGNVINGTGVDNITIKDITLIGGYETSWGNAYAYAQTLPAMTDGKKLLFLKDCDNVVLDNVTVTKGYASAVVYTNPEDRVESIYGMNMILICGGDNIRLKSCNHTDSSSEAWSIYNCTNVIVGGCIFDTNYGVSFLDVTYCVDVSITACQFMKRLISDSGELLNVASSRLSIDSNKFLNGNCDIGNEYLNIALTRGETFLLNNQVVSNNTLYNGIITCSTTDGTYTLTWAQENVVITGNAITIDIDTRPAATGSTVLDYAGISLPRYKNARNFLITGNTIQLKGALQTSGANPHLYNRIRLIDSVMLTTGLKRDNFSITNNRLSTDITSYDSDEINDTSAAIVIKYGEWTDLAIDNNYIDAPVGIYFEEHDSIARMSVSGNKIYGECGINFPWTNTTTDIADLTVANNDFVFWNTAGHTYDSGDFGDTGYGFFLTHLVGKTTTMPNTTIHGNTVKGVGFVYLSNAQTSASVVVDVSIADNRVDFEAYAASSFTPEPIRLGRANTANAYSTIRLVNNYFEETGSGIAFNLYEMDKLDLIGNVWDGVYTLTAATDDLSAVTGSRFVRKNNMGFGTLTKTYTNLSTAITQVDDGNSGGF